jgi:ribose 5-phosphate isomerase B
MKIVIASDHAGYEAKIALIASMKAAGRELVDLGTDSLASCDYPDLAALVAAAVSAEEKAFGVLVCGTGQGMAMTANTFDGIRAGVVQEEYSAEKIREHNDANVICFGARISSVAAMQRCLERFLTTDFGGDRHQRRVGKIESVAKDANSCFTQP